MSDCYPKATYYKKRVYGRVLWIMVCCVLMTLTIDLAAAQNNNQQMALPSRLAIHSLLLDGDQRAGLLVAVGERGHILYSEDQGQNWQQAEVPSRVLLTGVYLHNQTIGWAVGHDATILRTTDGARHWQQVYTDPKQESPLLDVWFKDEKTGFAIGAYGLLLKTVDGGETWTQRWVDKQDDFHLNHISQATNGTLYIAAEAGMVYRSEDSGETWKSLHSPYAGSFFATLPVNAQQLFLFGLRGNLFFSENNGENWQPINSQTQAMLTSGFKSRAGHCFIAGLNGVLLHSRDCTGGKFEFYQLPGRKGISAILEGKDNEIILLGEAGITTFKP